MELSKKEFFEMTPRCLWSTAKDAKQNYEKTKEHYYITWYTPSELFYSADKYSLKEQTRNVFMDLDKFHGRSYYNNKYFKYQYLSMELLTDELNKRIKLFGDGTEYSYKQIRNYINKFLVPQGYIKKHKYNPRKHDNKYRYHLVWIDKPNIKEQLVECSETKSTNKVYSKKNITSNKAKTNNIVEVNNKEYTKDDLKAIRQQYINSYRGFDINRANMRNTSYFSRKIYMIYNRNNENVDRFHRYMEKNNNSNIFEYYKDNTIENIEDIFNDAGEQFELIKQRFILYKEKILDRYDNSTHESLPEINKELAQIAKLLIDERFRLIAHRDLSQRTETIKLLNDYYANILKYFNNSLNFSLGDTSLKGIINLKLELIAFITRYYCSIPGDKEITILCQMYDEYKKRYNKDIYKIKAKDTAEVVIYDYCRLQQIRKAGVYVYYYLHQDEFKEKTKSSFNIENFNTAYNTSNFNKRCERYDDMFDEPGKFKQTNELDNNKVKNVLFLRRDKDGNILDFNNKVFDKNRPLYFYEEQEKSNLLNSIKNTRELRLIDNKDISDKEKDILAIKYLKQNIAEGTMNESTKKMWLTYGYLVSDLLEDEEENIYIDISNKDISDNIVSKEVVEEKPKEEKYISMVERYGLSI